MVCRPKDKGGLGVINLHLQNQALLIKHLHKFFNKEDIPWVSLIWNSYYDGVVPQATVLCGSFWWRDVFKLADSYRAISTATVNQGDSILFWSDSWILHNSNRPLRDRLPHLFSFVKDDKISSMDFLDSEDGSSMFHLPISNIAALELEHLLMSGLGLLNLVILLRASTPSCSHTFQQFLLVFGFGDVHAR